MIELTEAAKKHFSSLVEAQKGTGVRLSMKRAGCSGYKYEPEVVNAPTPSDLVVPIEADFDLFVDARYIQALDGIVIDFARKGFGQRQLTFNNPNAKHRCGCGESVMLNDGRDE